MNQPKPAREEMVTVGTFFRAPALPPSEGQPIPLGGTLLPRRADAFEEVTLDQHEDRLARLARARELLDAQADALMETDPPSDDPLEGHHAPHNPHRRPLSAAARRLICAHLLVEEAAQE